MADESKASGKRGLKPLPKPSQWKIRPSSAQPCLQTHSSFKSSLTDDGIRPQTAWEKKAPSFGSAERGPAGHSDTLEEELDLIRRCRRPTLAASDELTRTGADNLPRMSGGPMLSISEQLKNKIEEKIGLDTLDTIKEAFEAADTDGSGSLDVDEFKTVLRDALNIRGKNDEQITSLFMKIDFSSDGQVTWEEFCTYMQLEYAEKEDSYLRAREVSLLVPSRMAQNPHREGVSRLVQTADGTVMSLSTDGSVSFWSPSGELKRTRSVVSEGAVRGRPKWITELCLMSEFNKFIVGTGDREIQFWELSTFEAYCEITALELPPLQIDYAYRGNDTSVLLFGDEQGCVNILVLHATAESLRTWKKLRRSGTGLSSLTLERVLEDPQCELVRWQVHGDWVQRLRYYPELEQVVSCSNDEATALVIGSVHGSTEVKKELQWSEADRAARRVARPRLAQDQRVFSVYKGVRTFDLTAKRDLVATGGVDRVIRLWNPFVSARPVAQLRGHNAPLCGLFIDERRLVSVSSDKAVMVWDVHDHVLLFKLSPKVHKLRGELQASAYLSRTLVLVAEQTAFLATRGKGHTEQSLVLSHREPVTCCRYNEQFKQVITCSRGSSVKLWDLDSGTAMFEFGHAHEGKAVTCMTFDASGRRLITGGEDGKCRLWNFNNGHCLKVLDKPGEAEVSDVAFVVLNRNSYVFSVGWDRQVNIFADDMDDERQVTTAMPRWQEDELHGHAEDILCIAQCPPHLLATASYDGVSIVWNMVSGHVFCRLVSPRPSGHEDYSLDGDLSVNRVCFFLSRGVNKDGAALITSGPWGHLHFWNIYHGGRILARFPAVKHAAAVLTALELTTDEEQLFCADSQGFIYRWGVAGYCLRGPDPQPAELLTWWRGHVSAVTCLSSVLSQRVLVSSSEDCTVRLWTFDGHYVGTFGQPTPWIVSDPATYQHPRVPPDVLFDPLSVPSGELFEESEPQPGASEPELRRPLHGGKERVVSDEDIEGVLQRREYLSGRGKRLRHELMKQVRVDRGGPSDYQMLRCYNLHDVPKDGLV